MVLTINSTPKKDGYRMPGEFELHKGTWMLWPTRTDTWRSGAKPAQKAYAEVAEAISQFEPVTVCVETERFENARALLPADVRVVEISSNDAWMRDIGPTFIKNDTGEVRGVDWAFNAWGGLDDGLYFPWDKDVLVKQKVLEIEHVNRYDASDLVLEGGAITVDGEGTLITTEECLLNPNRNPNLTKEEVEEKLSNYLNIQKVIWLKNGLAGDETNGHVDEVLFYVRPGEVAIGWTDDTNHPQYAVLQDAYNQMKEETDAKGRKFTINKIQLPKQITLSEAESLEIDITSTSYDRSAGVNFIATYINCYLCNGGVILPVFNDRQDEIAIKTFENMFPDRKIVPVYTREISVGGGNIHCITQQQPQA
ncbi:agmatine deiminase [Virgibacillus necropolis]|uniref:Putative agmatine deiminase n=1 Tax=Virgibacillus necropolis TaxID=163877 RepID=A0A221MEY1_9BACI|nr:agmatine deiminase [Virgibacillus necropolis]ASN06233.1 agmatine deiminase [Virgibacillus necropolis]